MKSGMENRKKTLFIGDKFQRVFIIKFCILVTVAVLLSGAIVYLLSKFTLTTSFVDSRLVIKSTADFIIPAVLLSSAIVIIVMSIGMIAVALFTSSRKRVDSLYRVKKGDNKKS